MIESFNSKETEKIWNGETSRKLPQDMQRVARRKLRMLNAAVKITDLRIPPGNRLEVLKGDLAGYHSIRINQQWRIIFQWDNGNCYQVEIIDYH
ncbi:MAG: type II toxin-antitoxin system RelE/ParE family toxin [Bacteroidota bacterium]